MRTKLTSTACLLVLAFCWCGCAGWNKEKVRTDRVFGEIIGLCTKFSQGQPVGDLAMLTELHVRWVRDHDGWIKVEPVPGKHAFTPGFKQRLVFYREQNIGVVYCLSYNNPTAYPPTPEDRYRSIDPEAFGRYAAAATRLLRESGVRFVLEIWNEPRNCVLGKLLGEAWNGKPPCPWLDHYVRMARQSTDRQRHLSFRLRYATHKLQMFWEHRSTS